MNLKNLKVSKVQFEALKNIQPQSGMSVTPIQNMGVTAEDAPYLPQVVPVGTKSLDDIINEVAFITGESFEQSRFYWNTMIELVTKILTDGVHTEINFGFWTFALAVEGSVASADAQPNAIDNPVYFACYPSEELNRVAEQLETKRNISAQAFIIEEVFGVDTAKNRIVTAGGDMYVFGRKLSMGGTGEKAELVKGDNVYQLTFKASEIGDLPTRMTLTIPEDVPEGKDYVLRVTAFGKGHAVPEPEIVEKENITVLPCPTPPSHRIDSIKSQGYDNNFELHKGTKTTVTGAGIAVGPFDKVYLNLTTASGAEEENDVTDLVGASSSDTVMVADDGFWPVDSEYTDAQWAANDSVVKFRIEKTTQAGEAITIEKRVYLFAQA